VQVSETKRARAGFKVSRKAGIPPWSRCGARGYETCLVPGIPTGADVAFVDVRTGIVRKKGQQTE
jgi:hypothetical protein